MKRYNNFFQEIVSFSNLHLAARKALRGKKDRRDVAEFYFNLENELFDLRNELLSDNYIPRPYRQFEIREPKVRNICSSDFRDRVVHHAVCNVLEPVFEKRLIFDTYACRARKGTHLALERCQYFTRRHDYFLKCDIKKCFDSIKHIHLKKILRRFLKDHAVLNLLDKIIDHRVPTNDLGVGLPIGNLTSQHFANIYLGELDHYLKDRLKIKGYVRYMDDFICFGGSKEEMGAILLLIRQFLSERLELQLKEKVVTIAPVTEGVPFLGFRVFKNLRRIQRVNLVRLRQKLHAKESAFKNGHISEKELIQSVNSWVSHLSHGDTIQLRRKEFIKEKF